MYTHILGLILFIYLFLGMEWGDVHHTKVSTVITLHWFSYLIAISKNQILQKLIKFHGWVFKISGVDPTILHWISSPAHFLFYNKIFQIVYYLEIELHKIRNIPQIYLDSEIGLLSYEIINDYICFHHLKALIIKHFIKTSLVKSHIK